MTLVAIDDGTIASNNILNVNITRSNYNGLSNVVFTLPKTELSLSGGYLLDLEPIPKFDRNIAPYLSW